MKTLGAQQFKLHLWKLVFDYLDDCSEWKLVFDCLDDCSECSTG